MLLALLKPDLHWPGSRVPAVGLSSTLLSPGNVDSFPALLSETVWAFASITGLSPTPSSPALTFSLSQTPPDHSQLCDTEGQARWKPDHKKQRSTGAFPLGQFIRALIYL